MLLQGYQETNPLKALRRFKVLQINNSFNLNLNRNHNNRNRLQLKAPNK